MGLSNYRRPLRSTIKNHPLCGWDHKSRSGKKRIPPNDIMDMSIAITQKEEFNKCHQNETMTLVVYHILGGIVSII
jgi:hypothetical protein